MKKFHPTLKSGFALVAALALAVAALIRTPIHKTSAVTPASRISVTVTITFGKPGRCTGFGICKITLGAGAVSKRAVKGELSLEDNGKLALGVAGKVPDEEPTLVIDQDIPLSSDIAKKLGLKSATIEKGSYPFSGGRVVFNAKLAR